MTLPSCFRLSLVCKEKKEPPLTCVGGGSFLVVALKAQISPIRVDVKLETIAVSYGHKTTGPDFGNKVRCNLDHFQTEQPPHYGGDA